MLSHCTTSLYVMIEVTERQIKMYTALLRHNIHTSAKHEVKTLQNTTNKIKIHINLPNRKRASPCRTTVHVRPADRYATLRCAGVLALPQTAVVWSKLIIYASSSYVEFPILCHLRVFQSCIFRPCIMAPRFLVSRFPFSRFQRLPLTVKWFASINRCLLQGMNSSEFLKQQCLEESGLLRTFPAAIRSCPRAAAALSRIAEPMKPQGVTATKKYRCVIT